MNISNLRTFILLAIPLIIVQLALMIAAVVCVSKQQRFKVGTKMMWLIIVIMVSVIGPILYFVIGRREE